MFDKNVYKMAVVCCNYAVASYLSVASYHEDIFIRTVRPRRIVNCLIAPPRNILTYLLTYLLTYHASTRKPPAGVSLGKIPAVSG